MIEISLLLQPSVEIGAILSSPGLGDLDLRSEDSSLGIQMAPFYMGPSGPPGGSLTAGPNTGLVIIGTEIRLSIGTLPQVG